MLAPGADGLNGACDPYGLGTGSSPSPSGRYALGRGTAVVMTPSPISLSSASSYSYERSMVNDLKLFSRKSYFNRLLYCDPLCTLHL